MDIDKKIHDLTILYMQLEIKENSIVTTAGDDVSDFVNEYNHIYKKIKNEFK